MNFTLGFFDNLNLVHEKELNRATPINNVEGLERGVEKQYMFEEDTLLVWRCVVPLF